MKRLTLFLFALFTCLMTGGWLSAWAQSPVTDLNQLSNSKVYNIKSVRGFLLYSTNYTGNLAGSAGSGVEDAGDASATAKAQQFAIFTVSGKRYLYSVGAQKFVSSNGNYSDDATDALTFTGTGNANYAWASYVIHQILDDFFVLIYVTVTQHKSEESTHNSHQIFSRLVPLQPKFSTVCFWCY